jgi:hypothetical protein
MNGILILIKGIRQSDIREDIGSLILDQDALKQTVKWNSRGVIPKNEPVCLRFYLRKGDLFS